MKKAIATIAVILVLLVVVTVAQAGPVIDKILKKGELVIGTTGEYPPFSAKSKSGMLMGLDIDLGKIIASSMGVVPKFVEIPFPDLLSALEAGKIDIIIAAMTMTPERNLKVAFVGPYFISGQSLVTTKATALNAENLNDINKPDFTIAAPKGTTSEMIVRNNISKAKLIVAKDMDEALKLLLEGKVKAILTDRATGSVATVRHKDKGIVATNNLTFEPIGVAIPANDPLFVNFLDNVIGSLKGSGALQMMMEKWFKEGDWLQDLK
ncbi:MAG: transporter substrate-binding domain-containing protein [Proteobacteria bacterium]|nr:transporter substrate-binding domain-containing protein [Pseudomonadota bacterium]